MRRGFPNRLPAVLAASFLFSPPLSHGCLRLCLSPPVRRMVLPPYVSVFRLAAREQAPLSPLWARSVDLCLLFFEGKAERKPMLKFKLPRVLLTLTLNTPALPVLPKFPPQFDMRLQPTPLYLFVFWLIRIDVLVVASDHPPDLRDPPGPLGVVFSSSQVSRIGCDLHERIQRVIAHVEAF